MRSNTWFAAVARVLLVAGAADADTLGERSVRRTLCHEAATLSCAVDRVDATGWRAVAEETGANVFQWPVPLAPGDVVEDDMGGDDEPLIVDRPLWLFFADLRPGAIWGHPARLILVERETGVVHAISRLDVPRVNGVSLFATPEDQSDPGVRIPGWPYHDAPLPVTSALGARLASPLLLPGVVGSPATGAALPGAPNPVGGGVPPDDEIDWPRFPRGPEEPEDEWRRRVRGHHERLQPAEQAEAELARCPCPEGERRGGRFALVVDGGRLAHGPDIDALARGLRAAGWRVRTLRPGQPDVRGAADAETNLDRLSDAFDWLGHNVTSCCDEVFVYVAGHGSPDGRIDLNAPRTVRRGGRDVQIGSPRGLLVRTATLRDLLNRVKSCKVEVFLSSCFSGQHIEHGINEVPRGDADGCMCRTVATTSSSRQISDQTGQRDFIDRMVATGDFAAAFRAYRAASRRVIDPRLDNLSPLVQATDCALCRDPDGDGLVSGRELERDDSDPLNPDTDGDGLSDGAERARRTDPRRRDSDGDGLADGDEITGGGGRYLPSDPAAADSDGDGVDDRIERYGGSDPNRIDARRRLGE